MFMDYCLEDYLQVDIQILRFGLSFWNGLILTHLLIYIWDQKLIIIGLFIFTIKKDHLSYSLILDEVQGRNSSPFSSCILKKLFFRFLERRSGLLEPMLVLGLVTV